MSMDSDDDLADFQVESVSKRKLINNSPTVYEQNKLKSRFPTFDILK